MSGVKLYGAPAADGGYPAASLPLDGTEGLLVRQGGVVSYVTAQDVADLGGGGGTPGGADTQVQFNNAGAFGGDAGFTYNSATDTATLVNLVMTGKINEAKGADIAAAATTDIGAATGNFVHVTGSTGPITSLGTVQAGTGRIVRFSGTPTLTHNATSLILPSGANIVVAANDTAVFVSEGSGNWRCVMYQRASGQALVSGAASLTNWTEAVSTAAPNATTPAVSFTATNAATNVDAVLVPKGNGALLAAVPNNLASGGNKRGTFAVDLQTNRSNNTEVASGTSSAIPGGQNNTASGTHSFASGQMSTVSGNHAFGHGQNCTASGTHSVAIGSSCNASAANAVAIGASCTADGIASVTTGSGANTRALFGAVSHATATGKQRFELLIQRQTTDATPTALTTTGTAATGANQFIVPGNRTCVVRGRVVARNTSTGDSRAWSFDAVVKNIANVTSLVAAVTPTSIANDAGAAAWTIAVTADDANDLLVVTATGAAATTIAWTCDLHSVET